MYTSHRGVLTFFLLLLVVEVVLTTVVVQGLTWQAAPQSAGASTFRPYSNGKATTIPSYSCSIENADRLSGTRRCLSGLSAAPRKDDDAKAENGPAKKPSPSKKKISHLANDANLSSLTVNNPTWDQNIAALLEYKETKGTVNLPEKSKEYPNLGKWVYNLRTMKGRLIKEQIQQLNDIGFIWKDANMTKNDKQWHEMFTRLEAYKEEHGDCLVPIGNYPPDQKLANWVGTQRKYNTRGKIKPKRKEMLESIGFVWRLQDFFKRNRPDHEELWEKRYQELVEFKEEHGHTNVPQNYPPNKELGEWVHKQRVRNKDGTLRDDRIPLLDEIGFVWEFDPIWDKSWLEQYEELKTYSQDLASYKKMVENNPEGSEATTRPVLDENIRLWAVRQRRLHAKGDLDPQRKDMLDNIGFDWWE